MNLQLASFYFFKKMCCFINTYGILLKRTVFILPGALEGYTILYYGNCTVSRYYGIA